MGKRSVWQSVGHAAVGILQTGLEAAALFIVISLVIGRFEIHSVSMEPNLHEGQRVLVNKLDHLWPRWLVGEAEASEGHRSSPFAPQRGQVIVFYENAEHTGIPLVKRVIGLPGETVEIRGGRVLINGQVLDEPYLHGVLTTCDLCNYPIVLGPDQYWVMGDNRPNSRDSRSFGPIRSDQIVGEVILRYWPLDKVTLHP